VKLEPIYAITDANGNVEEEVDGSLEQTVEKALSVYGRHTPVYFNGDLEQLQKEDKHRKTVQRRASNPDVMSLADMAIQNLGDKFWDGALNRPKTFALEEVYEKFPDNKEGLKKAQMALRQHFPATGSVKILSADYGDVMGRKIPEGKRHAGRVTGSTEEIVRSAIREFEIEDANGDPIEPKSVKRHMVKNKHGGDVETIDVVFKNLTLHINPATGGVTTSSVVGSTYDSPAGMSKALLVSNAKTEKAVYGLEDVEPSLSKGLAFLPFTLGKNDVDFPEGRGLPMLDGPRFGVCIGSSAECRKSCLVYAGQNQAVAHNNVVKGARLGAFLYEPEAFFRMVIDSTRRHIKSSVKAGMVPYFRPNILSDLPWETMFPDYWRVFPSLRVYDYSKVEGRQTDFLGQFEERAIGSKEGILRYDLTYSFSGDNMLQLEEELHHGRILSNGKRSGRRVAVVFLRGLKHGTKGGKKGFKAAEPFPAKMFDRKIIDGDFHDLRPLDPQGTVVGLRFKSLLGALAGKREKQISRAGKFVVKAPGHGDVGDFDPAKYVVEVFRTPEGDLISAATPLQENVSEEALYGKAAE